MTEFPVNKVKVGKRHRKEMGNIDALAASIKDQGLIMPIAIWPDGTLAAGQRRLLAAKKLEWETIPVHVLQDADDLLRRLKVERDENTHRLAFAPSEAVAIGKELENLERPKAKGREKEGGRMGGKGSGKLPDPSKGQTRDKVAEAVGMSGRTYEKAKAVVEAAEEDPESFGPIQEEMDQTGNVDGAYRKAKEKKNPTPPPRPPKHPHSEMIVSWLKRVSDQTNIIQVEMGGLAALLSEPKKWDWRDVREFILPQLEFVGKTIARYRKEIEAAYATHQGQG